MSATSKVISAWTALTGFLEKHINDLNNVGAALGAINSSLPIDAQDKERISNAIAAVEESANNIADWLDHAPSNPSEVTLKESDIVEALGNYFASDAGKEALASALGKSNA